MEIKTAEKMLKEAGITALTKAHNYDYLYKSINEVIHSYAAQAVRLALEEVMNDKRMQMVCEVPGVGEVTYIRQYQVLSLEQSILDKLK